MNPPQNFPLFLRIPVAIMDGMHEPLSFAGLDADEASRFLESYAPGERAGIQRALEFAERHPNYDFAGLVPGIPYSNPQIHQFLCKLKRSLFFSR
ncbi:hypothetical protein [Paraburkholderia sp. RL17-373-BIF-A]|uniref:hypothetical protein n=1 Tax=Paraburkholderia sp. RL17-373-BIF-A TaxID=3031629 RepID=UPI0038BC0B1D